MFRKIAWRGFVLCGLLLTLMSSGCAEPPIEVVFRTPFRVHLLDALQSKKIYPKDGKIPVDVNISIPSIIRTFDMHTHPPFLAAKHQIIGAQALSVVLSSKKQSIPYTIRKMRLAARKMGSKDSMASIASFSALPANEKKELAGEWLPQGKAVFETRLQEFVYETQIFVTFLLKAGSPFPKDGGLEIELINKFMYFRTQADLDEAKESEASK